jgi:hypothetical protein
MSTTIQNPLLSRVAENILRTQYQQGIPTDSRYFFRLATDPAVPTVGGDATFSEFTFVDGISVRANAIKRIESAGSYGIEFNLSWKYTDTSTVRTVKHLVYVFDNSEVIFYHTLATPIVLDTSGSTLYSSNFTLTVVG